MGIIGCFIQKAIPHNVAFQYLGYSVPCTEIFPETIERNYGYETGFFGYFVIETDFGQFRISGASL